MNKNIKILLVDDVQGIVTFAQSVLIGLGYEHVDTAFDGEQALALIQQHQHDLVFLDTNLPCECETSLLCQIQATSPTTQVIMCSSQTTEEHVKQAIAEGAEGFLDKPITAFNMTSVIERLGTTH